MLSQEMRLRCKRSHMPCNLANFISVNQESEVGRGWQQGEDTRKKERNKVGKAPAGKERKARGGGSVTTTTDSTMFSDVWWAQSLCRREGSGKDEVRQ